MHCRGLYEDQLAASLIPDEPKLLIQEFIEEQNDIQATLFTKSHSALRQSRLLEPDTLVDAAFLLGAWDQLSLFICELRNPALRLSSVTVSNDQYDLQADLTHLDEVSESIRLRPWPFTSEVVESVIEGRVLNEIGIQPGGEAESYHLAPLRSRTITLHP